MTVSNPGINVTVHVREDTLFNASRVPSEDTDFVTVNIGWKVAIILHNPAQAKALVDAALEAYSLLKQIEIEIETKAPAYSSYPSWWEDGLDEPDFEDGVSDCTDENPCHLCQLGPSF